MNKWGEFSGYDRYALKYFQWMQSRVKRGYCSTDMTNDRNGYIEFCQQIGPIPPGMEKPTVGRKDHRLGYVRGNFAWQEWIENCRENDKERISENSKLVAKRIWSDPDIKERLLCHLRSDQKRSQQSTFMTGKKYAAGKRTERQKENMRLGRLKAKLARAEDKV